MSQRILRIGPAPQPAGIILASGKWAACRTIVFTALAFVLLCNSAWSGTTALSTLDGGGRHTTSPNYAMNGSISGISGVSSAMSPPVTTKLGYIGQLYEVTSLVVTAIPASVSEDSNSQLSATAMLDDGTVLAVADSNVSWGVATYPIGSINADGLVTPASVYTDTTGTVSGYYLGASNSLSLLVLDTNPDNFGIYANDGIPDGWQVQYFGTNNPEGVAGADADGTGQNNLFKYLAGLDPTNPASILRITATTKQGYDIQVTWTCEGGHSYVLQSTKAAAIAEYTTNFTDVSPVIVVSGNGESTTNYLDAGVAFAAMLTAPGGQNVTTSVVPSTVSISAANTRGCTDSLGQSLPIGSLLIIGTFSISESTIQSNFSAGNVSAIMSNFTPYSTSFAVGDGTGLPASWSVSRNAAGFDGQQIYLLAIDKPTFAAANHLGIFTAPSWVFPNNGNQINIDLADVTDFVIGAQGGSLTISLPLGEETYTFNDTAKLSYLPGRILFYRVRLAP
jgi:hypothetical protein